jgi:hypothetical protein
MTMRVTDDQMAALAAAGRSVQPCVSYLTFKLVDEDGDPVPGEPFEVELPDGSKVRGTTDTSGKAYISGVPKGTCKVCFPLSEVEKK